MLLASSASAQLSTSLAAAWRLDESSGNVIDYGPNNFTLVKNHAISTTTGRVYALAADFESSNSDTTSIADNAILSQGSGHDFTFVVWAKPESLSATMALLGKDNIATANREYNLLYEPTPNRWRGETFGSASAGGYVAVTADNFGAPSTGVWVCIIFKKSGSTVSIKVNNGTANTATQATVYDGAANFRVGSVELAGTPTNYFDGALGPIYYFTRATSDGEDTILYNAGNGIGYPFFLLMARANMRGGFGN